MTTEKIQDRCRGSLVGGAIGDALGYPVEFVSSFEAISARYGAEGITDYDLSCSCAYGKRDKAWISDDTQMTLYTAEGLLEASWNGLEMIPTICNAYLAWWGKQVGRKVNVSYQSKLSQIDELNQDRAPGNTCLTSLKQIHSGKDPKNSSKGCGGVMRVAPIGIYGACHDLNPERTARLAAATAELTHLHPLSTYASAALAVVVQRCLTADNVDSETFKAIVDEALRIVAQVYGADAPYMSDFMEIIQHAIRLADEPLPDWEIIEDQLGGGWVAEETLAIAIFSVLRHIDDFRACMISAVNHGGDSDSTGAVAGNIIGAILGYQAIPQSFKDGIQLLDLLLSMADRLSE